MTNPKVTEYDATTDQTVERQMTDEEMTANGWTPGDEAAPTPEPEPTPEEETPEE